MKDRDFLMWLYQRMINIYKEDPLIDYMWKLRSIINSTDKNQYTPNTVSVEEFNNG